MKANTLRRHVRESFKSLGRNGWMMFASVSAVTITLLLVGVFFVIMMNLNNVAKSIEEDVEIRVHIDVAASDEEQKALQSQIEKLKEVESVTFSPKEDELDNLITSLGEEGEAFTLFEQDNPLNDVFVVKTKNPTDTMKAAKQIEKMQFASKVKYGQGSVEKIFEVTSVSRNIGLILVVGLLFTAMFLISNTIKITIFARRKEIEIMKLVGATNGFIRWPFFLEGLWLGLLGSIIPIIVVGTTYYYAHGYLSEKLAGNFIQLLEFSPFIYQISGLLILLGALIGVWGSLMSVRKFLKV
ncbi:permease-like cell division protein FtsX [Niallia endozanthoxylica]|uniref:Cell division protein FtsX n=1 Tax=Niallia endozanthoxylica TaxID=2036016 RepID=A0A5J5HC61_9BACI|nr:permease-like cell division protein FtsX [Niallia endozanthoxylica]KAA9018031.1 ABC transporter permease [Niallia endozanthoxylica]